MVFLAVAKRLEAFNVSLDINLIYAILPLSLISSMKVTAHLNEHKATVESQEEFVSRESEKHLLTECPDVEVHSLRALAVRPLLILGSSPAPVTEVCFTSEELLQYSLDALQGVSSSLFCLNQVGDLLEIFIDIALRKLDYF